MVPQGEGVVGKRNDRERADHERQAEPKQAVRQIVQRSLPGDAGPDEQPRKEKEHRHEKTVGGEHDHVEAEERHRIGVTVVGIGNDGVVQQHDQRQKRAGAVKRGITRFRFRRGADVASGHGVGNRRHQRPRQIIAVSCCNREPESTRHNMAI
jgi:hypothetical protein